MILIVFYSYEFPFSGTHRLSIKLSVYFILFQITMPNCHKIYPNCIWHVPPEWYGSNFNSALLTNVYWKNGTHIVRVCVTSKTAINPNLPLPRKVIFKSNLALKQLLVCTILSAIILLHLRIHSSKNYSLIFLQVFTLISSNSLPTNTPRIMNEPIRLTPPFL